MKHYIWAVLWAAVVVVLCGLPSAATDEVPKFSGIDKLVHTGFFFVFTLLLYSGAIWRVGTFRPSWGIHLKVGLFSCLFSLFSEHLQWVIFIYRSGQEWEIFSYSVGTGCGVFVD